MIRPFRCPDCKVILTIDDAATKPVRCPKCSHLGTLDSYKPLQSTPRQCINCEHKWNQFHDCNSTASISFICPKCRCLHLGGNMNTVKGNCPNKNCPTNGVKKDQLQLVFGIDNNHKPIMLSCPFCNTKDNYNTFIAPPPKQPNTPQETEPGTKRISTPPPSNDLFCLEMVCDENIKWFGNSRIIELKEGMNIIGRAPKRNNAVALPTGDTFISKEHICINISKGRKGHLEHLITDISKNGTFLNYRNEKIAKEATYILQENDRIKMGYTTFIVRKRKSR